MIYLMHYFYSSKLHNTNVKIVTYMPYNTIWKIPTIIIDNGVDTSKMKVVEPEKHDTFNLTVVANVNVWHGIDRIINGLYEYGKKKNIEKIRIKIAGEGPELKKLKELVHEKKLEENVEFLGLLKNEQLDNLYNITDIAISSLGMHRIHITEGSTIKTKEYCSKGIPFILAYNEKMLQENFEYALKMPANEEPIDIKAIIEFYNKIQSVDYRNEMHEFAVKNYDWNVQIEKIITEI